MWLRSTGNLLEIFGERVKPDLFFRKRMRIVYIHFAPSLCASHMNPVRGLIASPLKAVRFDKGFQEDGGISVLMIPIPWQTFSRHRQQFGGQVFCMNPWENQKAGIVGNQVKTLLLLCLVPTDELISGSGFPSRVYNAPHI